MSRRAPILGILGLVFLAFALIEHWMTRDPSTGWFSFDWYALVHLGIGAAFLVWYFSAGSGSLASFVRARSTRYGLNAIVYTVVFIVLVGMANFLGTRYHHRFDLSAASVNSLSEQSRGVLDALEDDVEILAFVGPTDKLFVEETATVYGYYSDRLHFRIVDPQVNPELAQREGILSMPSLKMSMGERTATVRELGEEAITNGIHQVSSSEQKTVYFVQGHGEGSPDDNEGLGGFGLFATALKNQNYLVQPLPLVDAEQVPENTDVLIVTAAERGYLPAELDRLRAYMEGGGHTLFLLEPQQSPEIVAFLKAWGIFAGNDLILDRQMRMFEGPTLGLDPVVSVYGEHPSVEPMKERTLFSMARSLALASDAREGLLLTPLASTAPTSWAETDLARVFEAGEAELSDDDKPGPVLLAAAGDAFVADLGIEGGAADAEAHLRFAVFGDTSFVTNQYWQQLYNDALALSLTGWLAGQEELISIGPRAVRASRAHLGASEARTVFYLSVLVFPELILLAGIAVWWRRSSL